jgi:hypothetical protein
MHRPERRPVGCDPEAPSGFGAPAEPSFGVAFSPSGQELAVKNTSGECWILDSTDLGILLRLGGRQFGEGSPPAFAYDGAMIDGSWNGDLLARDIKSGGIVFHERERRRMVSLVAASPDRQLFAYSEESRGTDSLSAVIGVRRWPFFGSRARDALRNSQR